jgi:heme A synthase
MKDAIRYTGGLIALLFVAGMFVVWFSKRPDDSDLVRHIWTIIFYLILVMLGLGVLSLFA